MFRKGYLTPRDGKWRQVRLFDLALLLYFIHMGNEDKDIGFEETNETVEQIERKLNREIYVEPRIVEGALWAANLANEQGKFWHPHKMGFHEWVKKIIGRDKFDFFYNTITKAGSDE